MDIIYIFVNTILNLLVLAMYLMPFWIFDSISYFIDIYSNATFLLFLFIISFLLGFIYLVYMIELLNIHVNQSNIQWIKLSEDEMKKTPTFLWELLNFIFWKSNFWTFWPILVSYFSQIRLKIIPILIIMLILYIPLTPTNRWYNTVWEFFLANKEIIFYWAGINKWRLTDEDIQKRLKYSENWLLWIKNEDDQYRDANLILKSISEKTLRDKKINKELDNQISLYENVYDENSLKIEKEKLSNEISNLESKLLDLETKKDLSTQKHEIANYISQINITKEELKNKKEYYNSIDDTFNRLIYLVNIDENQQKINNLIETIWKTQFELWLMQKKLDFDIWKISLEEVEDIHNELFETIELIENNTLSPENQSKIKNNKKINEFFYHWFSEYTYTWNQLYNKNQLLQELEKAKVNLYNPSSNLLRDEIKEKTKYLFLIEEELKILWNIENDPNARIENIIQQNSNQITRLMEKGNLSNNEKRDLDILLLLQYKLITKQDDINPLNSTTTLFWNRVEYLWLNLISWFWLFVSIVSFIFTIIYYSIIVFLAWWKNMLILYLSMLNWIMSKINKFVEWTKFSKWVNNHIQKITNSIFPDWYDREYKWFQDNMNSKETYIIIWVEFLIRLLFIYWLFNF